MKNLAGATSEHFVTMFGAPLAFFTSFAAGPEVRIEPASLLSGSCRLVCAYYVHVVRVFAL